MVTIHEADITTGVVHVDVTDIDTGQVARYTQATTYNFKR